MLRFDSAAGRELRLDFGRLTVTGGHGLHRVGLTFDATPRGMPQGAIVLIRGDVYLATGANQWLGSLQAEEDLPNSDQVHYPRSLVLSFAMNDAQLTEL